MDRLKKRLSAFGGSGSGSTSGDADKSLKGRAQSFLASLNQQRDPQAPSDNNYPANPSNTTSHSVAGDQPPPPPPRRTGKAVHPKVKATPQIIGLVGDPALNRDSGGSCLFGDRILWTYRDTQLFRPDGSIQDIPIITSTASWSELDSNGGPLIKKPSDDCAPLGTIVHVQYGDNHLHDLKSAFFPICTPGTGRVAGENKDGSRCPFWPDQPPLVTSPPNTTGPITAYTFIRVEHIKGLEQLAPHPPTTLYRLTQHASNSANKARLPDVEIVDRAFWKVGEIPYGAYGTLVFEGYAYLYAQFCALSNEPVVALARVPASHIESRAAYTYFVNGCWTRDIPGLNTPGLNIVNLTHNGQGTFFFNPAWDCFVWIGGGKFPGASCYISTAPDPTGPWTEGEKFWEGPNGTAHLGAYSIQAHPAMGLGMEGRIWVWITYTKQDKGYSTPLVKIEWV